MRATIGSFEVTGSAEKRDEEFRPAWWLPGPHLQSLWGALVQGRNPIAFHREALPTPDGDELLLDHVDSGPGLPRVLLLHGLEGSSYSSYVQGFAALAAQRGWNITALNFRHCARDLTAPHLTMANKLPRLYHSGDSPDVEHVVRMLSQRDPHAPLFAAGASLGGSILLKYMGEAGDQCPLRAAMVVSVPYDLAAGEVNLNNRMGRFYLEGFLSTLRPKVQGLVERFPEVARKIDVAGLAASRRFLDLDRTLTAPLHGFASAEEYYARSSALGYLQRLRVPTLSLSSEDDPFVPPGVVERVRRVAPPELRVLSTPRGGHVGFVGGTPWAPVYWTESLFLTWFDRWVHAVQTSSGDVDVAA